MTQVLTQVRQRSEEGRARPPARSARRRGLKAIEHGYHVLFPHRRRHDRHTRPGTRPELPRGEAQDVHRPKLLIADEMGYLPIDCVGANLFFLLISRRGAKGPMILTSSQSFGARGEVFGDRVTATGILDRVLHHGITISVRGKSHRLRDKLKAGLVRTEEPEAIN